MADASVQRWAWLLISKTGFWECKDSQSESLVSGGSLVSSCSLVRWKGKQAGVRETRQSWGQIQVSQFPSMCVSDKGDRIGAEVEESHAPLSDWLCSLLGLPAIGSLFSCCYNHLSDYMTASSTFSHAAANLTKPTRRLLSPLAAFSHG